MMKLLFLATTASAAVAELYPRQSSSNSTIAYSPPWYPSPWVSGTGNWGAAVAQAKAFVAQMTLLEKVNITTGVGWQGERCVGQTGSAPRLGFRSLCLQDSPVGVRFADYISVFPAGVNTAATFSRGLARARGEAMGAEHRDKGVDIQLGPVAGPIGRAPAAGRNWEGFSPDPYLTGIMMAETITGIQSQNVIACAKHFIANEQEHFRQVPEARGYGYNITETLSSNVDDKTMHELYLWPFADAVRAGVGSVMCSYQQINNSYGCANSYTMNKLLKGELGFQGFIMSDWSAQHAGVATTLAGLDMTMPGDTAFNTGASYWGANLTLSILNGTVPSWRLDDMATRIMAAYIYVGRSNRSTDINFSSWTKDTYGALHVAAKEGYGLVNSHVDVRSNHGSIVRALGSASTVLLKNNGSLPLTGNEKFTAVFGADAGPNLDGPNGCPDRGCNNGTLGMAWGSGSADFPYLVTPAAAIEREVGERSGVVMSVFDNYADSQIKQTASQASVSIVFVNSDSGEGYISVDGNEGDRQNLTLWGGGERLIANVTAQCNNTIVVIHSTGPVLVTEWYQNPNVTAILWAGVPGQESGNSIADVLYGRVNPGAKLPFTMARARADYGADVLYSPNGDIPQQDFTEGVFIDYRAFDKTNTTPIYEFGYGLSYTTFEYSNLVVTQVSNASYPPTTGMTQPAPTLGSAPSQNPSAYVFPANFHQVDQYIYPYLNSTNATQSSKSNNYGANVSIPADATNGNPQPLLPASGAPGGNPKLWDILYSVTATVRNTGNITGEEVPQLYVALGGADNPKLVLRGFERLSIQPGTRATFRADLTRRDLSNWDVASQNWVMNWQVKTVYVGSSSRKLPLSARLQ